MFGTVVPINDCVISYIIYMSSFSLNPDWPLKPINRCTAFSFHCWFFDLLICTLITENQTLEKCQVLNTWIFFSLSPGFFFQIYVINLAFFRWRSRGKFRFAGPENFIRFEADLDFSRPWFSEIKVQIKRPFDWCNIALLSCQYQTNFHHTLKSG